MTPTLQDYFGNHRNPLVYLTGGCFEAHLVNDHWTLFCSAACADFFQYAYCTCHAGNFLTRIFLGT